MPEITFDICFDRLIGHEGGYVNDPNDPGGETNWGISKRSYPILDIVNLTREDSKAIYLRDFWMRVRADRLPGSVAYQLFDFAVNSGCDTAIRHLQKSVGVADDGYWGPISQMAADKMSESDMIMSLCGQRLMFMTGLSNWKYHGKGWARRIASNLLMAVGDTED